MSVSEGEGVSAGFVLHTSLLLVFVSEAFSYHITNVRSHQIYGFILEWLQGFKARRWG